MRPQNMSVVARFMEIYYDAEKKNIFHWTENFKFKGNTLHEKRKKIYNICKLLHMW